MLTKLGKKTEFVNGLRVTDKETVEIAQMVLAGKVNKSLVNLLSVKGGKAMGISGMDGHLIEAEMKDPELGYVGRITNINIGPIADLLEKGYIPVVSTIGCDAEGNTYNINADTAAWIRSGTGEIDYPIVHGADNSYYLNHLFDGAVNKNGTIFVDARNTPGFTDSNTIIYGHRTANKSMFGSLKSYAKQDYLKSHPYIYITDDAGSRTYAVFAAYEVGVRELTYRLGFEDEADKTEFLEFCVAASVVDTGIVPEVDDQILTLSTCTGQGYDTRWVVQAVLV